MSDAQDLVDGLLSHPWGQVSVSVYETARVVSLAPWLAGHERRVGYLMASQHAEGGWGPPQQAGYAVVPTLSAVEALLKEGPRAVGACQKGLAFARRLLNDLPAIPDTPAIEMIASSLIHAINARISDPLPLPPLFDDGRLELVKAAFAAGAVVPGKFFHSLEILGQAAVRVRGVQPENTGTIGASPAATAAWLGADEPDPLDPARRFLETAVRLHEGLVPVGLPIAVFERSWVICALSRAGVPFDPHPELLRSLAELLGPQGTPAAAGLPADADTTAGALYALALKGSPVSPDVLWEYETETHFCTWRGEDGNSVTTNAHVLEAFGEFARRRPISRYEAAVRKTTAWLCQQQDQQGRWVDRWHVSPYYATHAAALALHEFGGVAAEPHVSRAVAWVLDTQRPDGSWGVWGGSAEETAYAVQILALAGGRTRIIVGKSLEKAGKYLGECDGDHPALWHDKDLYLPSAVVRATVLAASRLVEATAGRALAG